MKEIHPPVEADREAGAPTPAPRSEKSLELRRDGQISESRLSPNPQRVSVWVQAASAIGLGGVLSTLVVVHPTAAAFLFGFYALLLMIWGWRSRPPPAWPPAQ